VAGRRTRALGPPPCTPGYRTLTNAHTGRRRPRRA
jgi:hypothetical protein